MTDLKKLAHEGAVAPLQAWLDEQDKRPAVNDLLWCALWTGDDACRRLLIELATEKKIKPKKGWPWNDAIAAAILGDVGGIAKAEKRKADFEVVTVTGTPLTTAIRLRHVDFVRALLEKGVDAKKPVKMARLQKMTVYNTNVRMTTATPLGAALRDGCEETATLLMEHVAVAPEHLADAVQGANEALLRRVIRVLDTLGQLSLTPKLFWSVHDPAVLPVLAEHGFDLSVLPDDTGTWGGPIWSWWAYNLRGETRLDAFEKLFQAGVRATAAGLGDVIGSSRHESPEMIELFLANGADLSDELTWEGKGWDEENDCEMVARGSVAEMRLPEADLEIVQLLHEKGAAIRPVRPDPTWRQTDEKKAWLERLGLVKSITRADFPWLESPSAEEIRAFLATEVGLFGLHLDAPKDELAKEWDVERAEQGDGLYMDFDTEDCLRQVSREWRDLPGEARTAIEEALTAALGKPKGGKRKKRWPVEGGHVTLRETSNDYYQAVIVAMELG